MTALGTGEGDLGLLSPSLSRGAFDEREPESALGLFEEEDFGFCETSVSVVDPDGLGAMGELAASQGYLWVQLEVPGPQYRGRLGLYLEEAIEGELEARGALSPGIHASTGLDASLSDQLYRARLVEMRGIAIGVPTLEGIVNLARALDADDSAVLRWWIAAAADRPVRLVLSNRNMSLRVYPSPVLFESLFDVAPAAVTPMPPSPAMAASKEAMDLSDLPPQAQELTSVLGTSVSEESSESEAETGESPPQERPAESWKMGPPASAPRAVDEEVVLADLDDALGLIGADASEGSVFSAGARSDSFLEDRLDRSDLASFDPRAPAVLDPSDDEGVDAELASVESSADQELVEPLPFELSSTELPVQELKDEPSKAGASQAMNRTSDSSSKGFDELDADDFLRTLEEDSSRAPHVAPAEAPNSHEQELSKVGEPAPLPTKNIGRQPFIRMVETEQVQEPIEVQATPEEARVEEPLQTSDQKELRSVPVATSAVVDTDDPFNQLAGREWKSWVKNLEAARGPKPLSVIERMFVTDYTRLREAVRRGVADPSASAILDEWQESFSQSYSEAFDALRMRGKRPTMVLDLPPLAARLGRLQGAKRVQLLLVDGLRFDLGLMVQDQMRSIAQAALTERLLLWSALPSKTAYQLNLLAAGPDGLKDRELAQADEPPALVARGKAACVPRRVKCGGLELLKLDVVADRLRQGDRPVDERLEQIAAETAVAIVEHLQKQPPRTMVVVFGDHGFSLHPEKRGTADEVSSGGASPEEVLVPAFAWLTGAVH